MEGIGILIFICFAITFGPPIILFAVGLSKRKNDTNTSNLFFILAALWLLVGGGICASILS